MRRIRIVLFLAFPTLLSLCVCAVSGGAPSAPTLHIGAYDGSTAVAINACLFATASDEDNVICISRRDGGGASDDSTKHQVSDGMAWQQTRPNASAAFGLHYETSQ